MCNLCEEQITAACSLERHAKQRHNEQLNRQQKKRVKAIEQENRDLLYKINDLKFYDKEK